MCVVKYSVGLTKQTKKQGLNNISHHTVRLWLAQKPTGRRQFVRAVGVQYVGT